MEELGKKIDEVSNYLTQLRLEIYTKYTLFTWVWWTMLIMCFVFIILFFVFVSKNKITQSLAYYGIAHILNRYLDDYATVFDWYDYRMQLEPVVPTNLPANLFVIPISLTIVYQRYEKWKPFMIAIAVFSFVVSYIIIPIMIAVGIYKFKVWNYHYSFISLIAMAVISKLLIDKAEALQSKAKKLKF